MVRYTKEMAEQAGLWGGTGDSQDKREKSAWYKYPWTMLAWRAFHLCVSRCMPEALGGLVPKEIAGDYDIETTATALEDPTPIPQPVSAASPAKDEQVLQPDSGGSQSAAEEGAAAGSEIPPVGSETAPETNGEGAAKADRKSKGAQSPSLEARLNWLKTATLEDLGKPAKDQPMLALKGLTADEAAAFCRALTDHKRELTKQE